MTYKLVPPSYKLVDKASGITSGIPLDPTLTRRAPPALHDAHSAWWPGWLPLGWWRDDRSRPSLEIFANQGAPKGPKWIGTKVLGHVPAKNWGSAGIPTSPCWFHGLLDDLAGSDEWLVYYWGLQNMFVKKLEEPSIT